jgi:hypothetical protein
MNRAVCKVSLLARFRLFDLRVRSVCNESAARILLKMSDTRIEVRSWGLMGLEKDRDEGRKGRGSK